MHNRDNAGVVLSACPLKSHQPIQRGDCSVQVTSPQDSIPKKC